MEFIVTMKIVTLPCKHQISLPDQYDGFPECEHCFLEQSQGLSLRSNHQRRVDSFMRLARQRLPVVPTILISEKERLLRAKLMLEEVLETITKGLKVSVSVESGLPEGEIPVDNIDSLSLRVIPDTQIDLVETVDGCADVKVVTTGTLSCVGVPDLKIQEEVDQNNLMKFTDGGHISPSGKWIKPPHHPSPDISGILSSLTITLS